MLLVPQVVAVGAVGEEGRFANGRAVVKGGEPFEGAGGYG
jgi:hypothetical protein